MSDNTDHGFRFSIDRGGTFTDVYAELPDGGVRVIKLLSEDPENYPDAPREGIRRVMAAAGASLDNEGRLGTERIEWIRMGTTVATNALLERKGEPTALVTTRGFRDILKIGYQNRPQLFDLAIRKPETLYERVIEVDERVRPLHPHEEAESGRRVRARTGEELRLLVEPNPDAVRRDLEAVFADGIRSLAVVFIHGYRFPDHEALVGGIARAVGFEQISLSHRVMPRIRVVSRGDTTTIDAYLSPVIHRYLEGFRSGFADGLRDTPLFFMQSDGGLVPADRFQGSNAILSGPAGGVVGVAMTTYPQVDQQPVIGFDMGGTSTDVSRFGGEYERVHETETAGVRNQAPQMNILTVAAGGGSRLFFENGLFAVGPESAGAHPGPVCYRKGGYPTVTDANLCLGRLQPDYFPRIFGPRQDQSLDLAAARAALADLAGAVNRHYRRSDDEKMSLEEVALGFVRVANQVMIRPIREISVMRGFDIREHVLACFGGAGGQHACAIARELGIGTIFIHRHAGILSAYGLGLADLAEEAREPAGRPLNDDTRPELEDRLRALTERAEERLREQGGGAGNVRSVHYLNLRYQGTDTPLMVARPADDDFAAAFAAAVEREFGFRPVDRGIIVDDIRVRSTARLTGLRSHTIGQKTGPPHPVEAVDCYFEGGWRKTPLFEGEGLGAGQEVAGPALIMQDTATIVVEPDCIATVTGCGDIRIEVGGPVEVAADDSSRVDPVRLSVFSNLFMSIAEQMGRTLQKTAVSTNIKERLDFSCALFDQTGGLVANAPHVPVHLGAMADAVLWQLACRGDTLGKGDVLLSNHPAAGGSHLPDMTVITPVMQAGKPAFFLASRGHHADIGGISPGSMPPFSKRLVEEGIRVRSFKLVEGGRFNEDGVRRLLAGEPEAGGEPMLEKIAGARRPADNISDLKAQAAANHRGASLLLELVERYSLKTVQDYMNHIQANAEQAVREMLRDFSEGAGLKPVDTVSAEDFMDDGSPIRLDLTLNRDEGTAVFDFSRSGPEVWGNWNTPPAVVTSAVLYALRCILDRPIPLNNGCLNPVQIDLGEGTLLNPSPQAAVAGGNVLTSQRIVDVVFRAFRTAAASQGCMNNLTFGNERVSYYETIGGGAGAGPDWEGQSGVHTHMTNTRITDPEILERRYPVVLRRFSLRSGSGGAGRHQGGDGLVREFEFLDRLQVSILSERRVFAPYGQAGGMPGARGGNEFIFADGRRVNLGGKNTVSAGPGDILVIKTPGGGGWGRT